MNKKKKMNCPYCDGETEEGKLEIHGSWIGWLLVGFSYQNLFYNSFNKKYQEYNTDDEKVIKESETLKAKKCKECGAISFIPGKTIDKGGSVRQIA
ncbi:hypothetical protein K8R62_01630 [bacterium]|nr:hypothetical protein [bacterium]